MSLEEIRNEAITFFSEAINKWARLIQLFNEIQEANGYGDVRDGVKEANEILAWFQENYVKYAKYSDFIVGEIFPNGKRVITDPIFDVIFRGANIQTICRRPYEFAEELNEGMAHLRGHLASVRSLKSLTKKQQADLPLIRIRRILSRFNLVANQLKRRRKDKEPFLVEDEYDVQDLLHALLKVDFDDIRKEEWTPSYAGGASKIDFVLKNEEILIEVKKTSKNTREKEIGEQLLVDIAKYKEYPNIRTLICFIYDPEKWIENPEGLKHDLEKKSPKELNVEVIISQ
jgi:hypothetical protein